MIGDLTHGEVLKQRFMITSACMSLLHSHPLASKLGSPDSQSAIIITAIARADAVLDPAPDLAVIGG